MAPPDPSGAGARVLFVDDDELVLEGLRDGLRRFRRCFTMTFLSSASAALDALDATPPDVVVCDLRMPGMDGASLLELVRDRAPSAARIVLSGHADIGLVARAAAVAHRLVAKPCDTDELVRIIQRSCALREIARRVELDPRALGASALPSVPRACAELGELLHSGTAGAADIAQVINHDAAMAAKVLQLANSAYFGRRRPTTSVADAVAYLGTDTLRALLLHAGAFRAFPVTAAIPGFDLNGLQRRCNRVGSLARAILTDVGGAGDAFTGGLLHEVGLLVLASHAPEDLGQLLSEARQENLPVIEVERRHHRCTHAEIGAHLLALWGLPHATAEAVAGHHDVRWLRLPFDAVAAVHFAAALMESAESGTGAPPLPAAGPQRDYLQRAALDDRLGHWQQLAQELASTTG